MQRRLAANRIIKLYKTKSKDWKVWQERHFLSLLTQARSPSLKLSTLRRGHSKSTRCPSVTSTRTTCGFWNQRIWTEAEESTCLTTLTLCTNSSNNTALEEKKPQRKTKTKTRSPKKQWTRMLMARMVIKLKLDLTLREKIKHQWLKQHHPPKSQLRTKSSTIRSSSRSTLKDPCWSTKENSTSECGLFSRRTKICTSSKKGT